MIVPVQHLQAYQGDDWDEIADFGGADITGASLWLTVKRYPSDADNVAILQISSPSGITILSATSASFSIPRATLAAAPHGSWHYDVQALLASGKKRTALRGTFEILPEITRA
jgi:hypothetical protein